MNYRDHLLIGIATGLIMMFLTHYFLDWFCFGAILLCWKPLLMYLPIIFLYSLLADCDHAISKVTWFFIGISATGLFAGYYYGDQQIMFFFMCLLAVTFVCAQFFPHRGVIHSIPAGILFSLPLYFMFGLPEAVLGLVCFYSHLAADGEWFKWW